jgi:hypothetical protein
MAEQYINIYLYVNGWGEIRTHDTVSGMPVFETGAFNHSATHPSSTAGET